MDTRIHQFDRKTWELYLQITEMSEEEIWTEEIDHEKYRSIIHKGGSLTGFAYFLMSREYVAATLVDF